MFGDLLNFAGSMFGASKARSAAKSQQAVQIHQAEKDRALQREFAQKGIQWRVEDAKAAGLHPLYAVGATGASYSPQAFIPGQSPTGDHYAQAGQALGRAAQSAVERRHQAEVRMLDKEERRARIGEIRARQGYYNQQVHDMALNKAGGMAANATHSSLSDAGLGYLAGGSSAARHTRVEPWKRLPETGTKYQFFGIPITARGGHTPTQFVEDYYGDVAGAVHGIPRYIYDIGRSGHEWYRGKMRDAYEYGMGLGRKWFR